MIWFPDACRVLCENSVELIKPRRGIQLSRSPCAVWGLGAELKVYSCAFDWDKYLGVA